MPNTEPPIDSAGVASEVLALGVGCLAEVSVAGAITVGRAGHALAPLAELAALGVTLFTDDGAGVQDGALMRRALDYAKGLGVTLAQHCEDTCLAAGGAMHEGTWSSRLGIPGMPAAAEEAMVAARHRTVPPDRRPGALPPHVHGRFGRPDPPCQGGGSRRSPPRRRPTTSSSPTPWWPATTRSSR